MGGAMISKLKHALNTRKFLVSIALLSSLIAMTLVWVSLFFGAVGMALALTVGVLACLKYVTHTLTRDDALIRIE